MNFTIDGSGGALAAGQGIGNMFKAAAMAPMLRQQSETDAALKGAQIYHHNMAGNKLGTEAEQKRGALTIQNDPLENSMLSLGLPTALAPAFRERITTGQWGGSYAPPADGVGPTMPAPADAETVKKLAQAMSLTQRMFATGSNVDQGADAALKEKKARGIDAVVANPALAGNYGKANAAAEGKPLFNDVGNTGYSMDNFTGGQIEGNPVLAKIFNTVQTSMANENNAQAKNANASARKHTLEGDALEGAAGGSGGSGKPLTNAQLRTNQDVEAARKYVNDLPRETVAAVLRKNEMDLTQQDKDILARIKKARTAKFGESAVPDQYNDMLGLDQKIVQQLAGALANPGTNQAGVLSKLFGGTDKPMTEEEIIKGVMANAGAAELPNQAQYVAAAKGKKGAGLLTHDGLPARQNSDGTYSTEVSITVTNPKLNGGKPTNIPSLWGGKEVSEEQAIEKALASGKKYDAFPTIDAAVAAAKARSNAGGAGANKNPSGGGAAPKIEAKVPAGYKQIGTSNGKPVYQAPDGKKYIME